MSIKCFYNLAFNLDIIRHNFRRKLHPVALKIAVETRVICVFNDFGLISRLNFVQNLTGTPNNIY
jgi:hypothetical protein